MSKRIHVWCASMETSNGVKQARPRRIERWSARDGWIIGPAPPGSGVHHDPIGCLTRWKTGVLWITVLSILVMIMKWQWQPVVHMSRRYTQCQAKGGFACRLWKGMQV